ncbi:hypothetical protein L210DRAFT_3559338 [Boletus edulis BED1]|uniref:Rhodopsin domain-containing protein n=1 Tax=Boletus edulis BED1 TaxID=1328754 RepID=A0AAD4BJ88_BOLED|nr:hypothetical protein L210DRAFT_3559338 [Boletus edulis BED1]
MVTIRVVGSVLQSIGILLSLFRLWFRLQIQRLWWEDAWAFIACICSITVLASEWVYLKGDWGVSVVGFWVYSMSFNSVVWAVRMSILYSVARIAHPTQYMRRMVTALSVLFTLMFLAFTAMKLWWFIHDLSWLKRTGFYTRPSPGLPRSMYIYELCTDCLSDAILIFLPVRLLWRVNLPEKQRRMIIAIFFSSIIVTMVSIFRAVSQIMDLLSLVGVATDIQTAFATITCNLLVIATLVYRLSRRLSGPDVPESDSEDDDYTRPFGTRITTQVLTTIDFHTLYCSQAGNQQGAPLNLSHQ